MPGDSQRTMQALTPYVGGAVLSLKHQTAPGTRRCVAVGIYKRSETLPTRALPGAEEAPERPKVRIEEDGCINIEATVQKCRPVLSCRYGETNVLCAFRMVAQRRGHPKQEA